MSDAENSLVVLARHETLLYVKAAETKRRMHAVGILVAIAVLVFAYDVLTVLLTR